MNREIEFRGKLSHSGAWVFGSLLKINKSYHILRDSDMYEDGHHVCQESDCPTWVELDTVGQFTGLVDKNGVKIFEGDIVRYDDTLDCDYVRYDEKQVVKFIDGSFYPVSEYWCQGIMVIGNIHDNPELLDAKQA